MRSIDTALTSLAAALLHAAPGTVRISTCQYEFHLINIHLDLDIKLTGGSLILYVRE